VGRQAYDVYVNNIELNPSQWNRAEHGLEGLCLAQLHTVTPI
jgi:hypothetical protein